MHTLSWNEDEKQDYQWTVPGSVACCLTATKLTYKNSFLSHSSGAQCGHVGHNKAQSSMVAEQMALRTKHNMMPIRAKGISPTRMAPCAQIVWILFPMAKNENSACKG